MKRVRMLVAAAVLAVGAGILPALADEEVGAGVRSRDGAAADVGGPVSAKRSESPGRDASEPRPSRTPTETAERPERQGERLRMACTGVADRERHGIACKWSASEHPDFAGYVLHRGDGEARTAIFRTTDRSQTHHFDTEVRTGVTYAYAVQVLDAQGNTIGTGGPVRAQIERRHEELRMACAGRERGIVCEWSPSRHPEFAGYILRRGGDGTRTVVFRTRERSETRFPDSEVEPGVTYIYAVHVVNAQGEVIGSGGPVRARTRGEPQPRVSPSPRDGRPPR